MVAAEGQGDCCRAHIGDRLQAGSGARRGGAQQRAAGPGRRREHHGVGLLARAVGECEHVRGAVRQPARGSARAVDGRTAPARRSRGGQRGRDRVAQVGEPGRERVEVAALRADAAARATSRLRRRRCAGAAARAAARAFARGACPRPRLAAGEHADDQRAVLLAPSRGTSGRWRARSSARDRRRGCRRRSARRPWPAPRARAGDARSRPGSRRRVAPARQQQVEAHAQLARPADQAC